MSQKAKTKKVGSSTGFISFSAVAATSSYEPKLERTENVVEKHESSLFSPVYMGSDSDLAVVAKKLLKKDVTTRLKAFADLQSILDERGNGIITDFLPNFLFIYVRYWTDNHRGIRKELNRVLLKLFSIDKRAFQPYMKQIIGPWWISTADIAEVADIAQEAFNTAILPKKRTQVLCFLSSSIFECCATNFAHRPETLSDMTTCTAEEAEERYIRVITTSLDCLTKLINTLDLKECESLCESSNDSSPSDNAQMFTEQQKYFDHIITESVWKKTSSKIMLVRKAAYSLITACCLKIPQVVKSSSVARLSSILLQCMGETAEQNLPSMYEAFMTFAKTFPSCWEHVDVEKGLVPKFKEQLRICPALALSYILPVLGCVTPERISLLGDCGNSIDIDSDPAGGSQTRLGSSHLGNIAALDLLLDRVVGMAETLTFAEELLVSADLCVLEGSILLLLRRASSGDGKSSQLITIASLSPISPAHSSISAEGSARDKMAGEEVVGPGASSIEQPESAASNLPDAGSGKVGKKKGKKAGSGGDDRAEAGPSAGDLASRLCARLVTRICLIMHQLAIKASHGGVGGTLAMGKRADARSDREESENRDTFVSVVRVLTHLRRATEMEINLSKETWDLLVWQPLARGIVGIFTTAFTLSSRRTSSEQSGDNQAHTDEDLRDRLVGVFIDIFSRVIDQESIEKSESVNAADGSPSPRGPVVVIIELLNSAREWLADISLPSSSSFSTFRKVDGVDVADVDASVIYDAECKAPWALLVVEMSLRAPSLMRAAGGWTRSATASALASAWLTPAAAAAAAGGSKAVLNAVNRIARALWRVFNFLNDALEGIDETENVVDGVGVGESVAVVAAMRSQVVSKIVNVCIEASSVAALLLLLSSGLTARFQWGDREMAWLALIVSSALRHGSKASDPVDSAVHTAFFRADLSTRLALVVACALDGSLDARLNITGQFKQAWNTSQSRIARLVVLSITASELHQSKSKSDSLEQGVSSEILTMIVSEYFSRNRDQIRSEPASILAVISPSDFAEKGNAPAVVAMASWDDIRNSLIPLLPPTTSRALACQIANALSMSICPPEGKDVEMRPPSYVMDADASEADSSVTSPSTSIQPRKWARHVCGLLSLAEQSHLGRMTVFEALAGVGLARSELWMSWEQTITTIVPEYVGGGALSTGIKDLNRMHFALKGLKEILEQWRGFNASIFSTLLLDPQLVYSMSRCLLRTMDSKAIHSCSESPEVAALLDECRLLADTNYHALIEALKSVKAEGNIASPIVDACLSNEAEWWREDVSLELLGALLAADSPGGGNYVSRGKLLSLSNPISSDMLERGRRVYYLRWTQRGDGSHDSLSDPKVISLVEGTLVESHRENPTEPFYTVSIESETGGMKEIQTEAIRLMMYPPSSPSDEDIVATCAVRESTGVAAPEAYTEPTVGLNIGPARVLSWLRDFAIPGLATARHALLGEESKSQFVVKLTEMLGKHVDLLDIRSEGNSIALLSSVFPCLRAQATQLCAASVVDRPGSFLSGLDLVIAIAQSSVGLGKGLWLVTLLESLERAWNATNGASTLVLPFPQKAHIFARMLRSFSQLLDRVDWKFLKFRLATMMPHALGLLKSAPSSTSDEVKMLKTAIVGTLRDVWSQRDRNASGGDKNLNGDGSMTPGGKGRGAAMSSKSPREVDSPASSSKGRDRDSVSPRLVPSNAEDAPKPWEVECFALALDALVGISSSPSPSPSPSSSNASAIGDAAAAVHYFLLGRSRESASALLRAGHVDAHISALAQIVTSPSLGWPALRLVAGKVLDVWYSVGFAEGSDDQQSLVAVMEEIKGDDGEKGEDEDREIQKDEAVCTALIGSLFMGQIKARFNQIEGAGKKSKRGGSPRAASESGGATKSFSKRTNTTPLSGSAMEAGEEDADADDDRNSDRIDAEEEEDDESGSLGQVEGAEEGEGVDEDLQNMEAALTRMALSLPDESAEDSAQSSLDISSKSNSSKKPKLGQSGAAFDEPGRDHLGSVLSWLLCLQRIDSAAMSDWSIKARSGSHLKRSGVLGAALDTLMRMVPDLLKHRDLPAMFQRLLPDSPRSGSMPLDPLRRGQAWMDIGCSDEWSQGNAWALRGSSSTDLQRLATYALFRTVCCLPAMVRTWWSDDCGRVQKLRLSKFIEDRVRQSLVAKEVALIAVARAADRWDADELVVKGSASSGEICAVYSREDTRIEMKIKLPPTYPLKNVQVECTTKFGISDGRWRRWVLQIVQLLSLQDGSVVDAVLMWKKNVEKEFEGVEPCPICYSILHPKTMCMPSLTCPTCVNKFHSECLYTWFKSSGKSKCVLCQQPFFQT